MLRRPPLQGLVPPARRPTQEPKQRRSSRGLIYFKNTKQHKARPAPRATSGGWREGDGVAQQENEFHSAQHKESMRANDHLALVLIGRGNEHMTWRCSSPLLASVSPLLASASAHASASAASTRHVLRIRHAPAASSVSSLPLPALAAIVGADCLSMPLAGLLLSEGTISDLLDAGSTGKKPPPSALLAVEDALRASIESDHASLCDSANAWIEVDCTMATGAGGNICIEIKPKGAHLPVGRPLDRACAD